jgi:hypothetical protein
MDFLDKMAKTVQRLFWKVCRQKRDEHLSAPQHHSKAATESLFEKEIKNAEELESDEKTPRFGEQ